MNRLPILKEFLKGDGGAILYKNVDIEFVSGRKATMTVYRGDEEGDVVETIILSDYETEEEMHGIFERLEFEKLTQEELDEKIQAKKMHRDMDQLKRAEERRRRVEQDMAKTVYETEKDRYEKLRSELLSRDGNNEEEIQKLDERYSRVLGDLMAKQKAPEDRATIEREL